MNRQVDKAYSITLCSVLIIIFKGNHDICGNIDESGEYYIKYQL